MNSWLFRIIEAEDRCEVSSGRLWFEVFGFSAITVVATGSKQTWPSTAHKLHPDKRASPALGGPPLWWPPEFFSAAFSDWCANASLIISSACPMRPMLSAPLCAFPTCCKIFSGKEFYQLHSFRCTPNFWRRMRKRRPDELQERFFRFL